jgi:hypothetical protein
MQCGSEAESEEEEASSGDGNWIGDDSVRVGMDVVEGTERAPCREVPNGYSARTGLERDSIAEGRAEEGSWVSPFDDFHNDLHRSIFKS